MKKSKKPIDILLFFFNSAAKARKYKMKKAFTEFLTTPEKYTYS